MTDEEKISDLIQLCKDYQRLAEEGDYSNGNEAFGVDEGQVQAHDYLKRLEDRLNKLRSVGELSEEK